MAESSDTHLYEYVDIDGVRDCPMCKRCGALVYKTHVHNAFHAALDAEKVQLDQHGHRNPMFDKIG